MVGYVKTKERKLLHHLSEAAGVEWQMIFPPDVRWRRETAVTFTAGTRSKYLDADTNDRDL